MKVSYTKNIHNLFQGPPNPGFRSVKVQRVHTYVIIIWKNAKDWTICFWPLSSTYVCTFFTWCSLTIICRIFGRGRGEGVKKTLRNTNGGQSGFYNLALTERNMQIRFDLKLSAYSLGVEIWLLFFKFHFSLIGWPPQPLRERILKINKIEGFWWSISHWETKIGLFGAMVDGNIKSSNLFCEMRLLRSLRPLRLLRLLRSLRLQSF